MQSTGLAQSLDLGVARDTTVTSDWHCSSWGRSSTHSFNKHLPGTLQVPNTALTTRNPLEEEKRQIPTLGNLHSTLKLWASLVAQS